MKTLTQLTLVTASILIAGCQAIKPAQNDTVVLSKNEIVELFSGKTVESVGSGTGITSFTYYDPDGTLIQHRYWTERTGRWHVNAQNEICLAIENGSEKCRSIVLDPGSFFDGYRKRYYKYLIEGTDSVELVRYRQFIEGNLLDE